MSGFDAYIDDYGISRCGCCDAELICNDCGDMPETCPGCGCNISYGQIQERKEK